MYLLYLDDSGSGGNVQETHLVLGGVLIFERQIHWITQKLEELAKSISPSNPELIEFHASEIFNGRTNPWKGMSKEERRDVIIKVLKILVDSHDTTSAFACAVHKPSFSQTNPMEAAFEELCNRFDRHLGNMHQSGNTQRGLIILDESSHETHLQALAHDFQSLGTRWGVLRNIPEVRLFVDSKASRLVQLADHIAYAVFRRYEHGDTRFLDIILGKFVKQDSILHSLKHKTTDFNCTCPSCINR